jgi:hypothetical protein
LGAAPGAKTAQFPIPDDLSPQGLAPGSRLEDLPPDDLAVSPRPAPPDLTPPDPAAAPIRLPSQSAGPPIRANRAARQAARAALGADPSADPGARQLVPGAFSRRAKTAIMFR